MAAFFKSTQVKDQKKNIQENPINKREREKERERDTVHIYCLSCCFYSISSFILIFSPFILFSFVLSFFFSFFAALILLGSHLIYNGAARLRPWLKRHTSVTHAHDFVHELFEMLKNCISFFYIRDYRSAAKLPGDLIGPENRSLDINIQCESHPSM